MFVNFFYELKSTGIPVSPTAFLTLHRALAAGLVASLEDFYVASRAILLKSERWFDLFDGIFAHHFHGAEMPDALADEMDEAIRMLLGEWLKDPRQLAEFLGMDESALAKLTPEELEAYFKARLQDQTGRHDGGNKWIGTGGTSPFGHGGYNPEGIRIGGESTHKRAVKVWDKREFKDLDDEVELGTRNIKVALRRLRKFARTGAPDELDLDGTIKGTAHKGYLDIHMRPERHNAVKVLLFFDIGGSMDWHIKATEELFSAARTEFKHMEHFYFHNCLYEKVWKENRRRFQETTPTWDVLHTYPHDYKVVFVGDASMSPYEITAPGGSVEHFNDEPGATWLERVMRTYPAAVWLNPVPEKEWDYTYSIQMVRQLMGGRMYPLTLEGLDRAMRELVR